MIKWLHSIQANLYSTPLTSKRDTLCFLFQIFPPMLIFLLRVFLLRPTCRPQLKYPECETLPRWLFFAHKMEKLVLVWKEAEGSVNQPFPIEINRVEIVVPLLASWPREQNRGSFEIVSRDPCLNYSRRFIIFLKKFQISFWNGKLNIKSSTFEFVSRTIFRFTILLIQSRNFERLLKKIF